ncbi:hypothetical protein ABNJ30_20380, partial [Acinetobacter baumannii]
SWRSRCLDNSVGQHNRGIREKLISNEGNQSRPIPAPWALGGIEGLEHKRLKSANCLAGIEYDRSGWLFRCRKEGYDTIYR